MIMKAGDIAYLVESNRFVREVQIVRYSGGLYLVRFSDSGGGIQVRENRLFPTQELAKYSIKGTIYAERKKVPKSLYDYWY